MNLHEIGLEIQKLKDGRMSPDSIFVLAQLLYIRRHWHEENRSQERDHPKLDKQMAMAWTAGMVNADGTAGPHWSMERIQEELEQRGIKCDPVKFWAVINAIYSDDAAVAKKHGVNTMDYYVDRAKAWLSDKDAVPDKAEAYYMYVVDHG